MVCEIKILRLEKALLDAFHPKMIKTLNISHKSEESYKITQVMKVLTVIIPTYNMSKYLNRCLDSLVLNTDDLEVLIINDGSKDNSSEIAHKYQNSYPNIFRVIDKENGNYGSCVNRGLQEATGKYVKVLDADDYFNTSIFLFMEYLKAADADLILSSYSIVKDDGSIIEKRTFNIPEGKVMTVDEAFVLPDVLRLQMHAVTYKRCIFKHLDYHQTEGISYTDSEWVFMPMCAVNSVEYFDVNLYQYLIGRIGQSVDEKNYVKNIGHLQTTIFSRLKWFRLYRDKVSKVVNSYLNYKLFSSVDSIYKRYLIKDQLPVDTLKPFDEKIQQVDAFFYDSLNYCKVLKYPYIRHYRLSGEIAPWTVRKFFFIGKKIKSLLLWMRSIKK